MPGELEDIAQYLSRIETLLLELQDRPDEDVDVALSSTQPYKLDYRGFKYLYVLSASVVTLTIEDIATITPVANQWCNISFMPGMRIFASSSSSLINVTIRATNHPPVFISPLAVAQTINSKPLSATNPEPNISNIQQMMMNGAAWSCATGNTASSANNAMQFFTANALKNIIIWSVRAMYDGASIDHKLQYITVADLNISAGLSVIANALNHMGGPNGNAPASGVGMWIAGGVASTTGTQIEFDASPVSQGIELMSPGDFRIIPAGQAGGVAVYSGTAASNKVGYTVKWVEF